MADAEMSHLMDLSELKTTISSIRSMQKDGRSISDVRAAHYEFCKRYPTLVDKLMEKDVNEEQLNYLIQMFAQVQSKKSSFESANEDIGTAMYERFLAPSLTSEQRARVKSRMKDLRTLSPEEMAQAAASLGQNTNMPASGMPSAQDMLSGAQSMSFNRQQRRAVKTKSTSKSKTKSTSKSKTKPTSHHNMNQTDKDNTKED